MWYPNLMPVPSFSLPDQNNKIHTLEDYRGQWLVIYFYPKDDTPGCTKEACSFRDHYQQLTDQGIKVIGISKDSTKSHQKFADKFSLNFPLLSDPSIQTIQAFGAWGTKKFMGKTYEGILRNTYLINPQGEIVKTYESVKPDTHVQEILEDLKSLISPIVSS